MNIISVRIFVHLLLKLLVVSFLNSFRSLLPWGLHVRKRKIGIFFWIRISFIEWKSKTWIKQHFCYITEKMKWFNKRRPESPNRLCFCPKCIFLHFTKPKDRQTWELYKRCKFPKKSVIIVKNWWGRALFIYLPDFRFSNALLFSRYGMTSFYFQGYEFYFMIHFTIQEDVTSLIMSWISMAFSMISVFILQSCRFVVP